MFSPPVPGGGGSSRNGPNPNHMDNNFPGYKPGKYKTAPNLLMIFSHDAEIDVSRSKELSIF